MPRRWKRVSFFFGYRVHGLYAFVTSSTDHELCVGSFPSATHICGAFTSRAASDQLSAVLSGGSVKIACNALNCAACLVISAGLTPLSKSFRHISRWFTNLITGTSPDPRTASSNPRNVCSAIHSVQYSVAPQMSRSVYGFRRASCQINPRLAETSVSTASVSCAENRSLS